jgi:hypothetical protein
LRKLLNTWNPIGCSLPPDEYGCLIDPLLSRLRRGCKMLSRHFGRAVERGVEEFSAKVILWYKQGMAG